MSITDAEISYHRTPLIFMTVESSWQAVAIMALDIRDELQTEPATETVGVVEYFSEVLTDWSRFRSEGETEYLVSLMRVIVEAPFGSQLFHYAFDELEHLLEQLESDNRLAVANTSKAA